MLSIWSGPNFVVWEWVKSLFAGIWIRDIRFKCNLLLTQVNKILKNLESKKLIKAVKSVAVSKALKTFFPDHSRTFSDKQSKLTITHYQTTKF